MIIGLVLLVLMTGLIIYANIKKDGIMNEELAIALGVGLVIAIGFSMAAFIGYMGSIATYSKIEAFAEVRQMYQESITSTADAVVELDNRILGVEQIAALVDIGISVENLKHSSLTASRIKEARDYQRKMLETRHYYRMITGNWFLRMFVAKPPKSLFE